MIGMRCPHRWWKGGRVESFQDPTWQWKSLFSAPNPKNWIFEIFPSPKNSGRLHKIEIIEPNKAVLGVGLPWHKPYPQPTLAGHGSALQAPSEKSKRLAEPWVESDPSFRVESSQVARRKKNLKKSHDQYTWAKISTIKWQFTWKITV